MPWKIVRNKLYKIITRDGLQKSRLFGLQQECGLRIYVRLKDVHRKKKNKGLFYGLPKRLKETRKGTVLSPTKNILKKEEKGLFHRRIKTLKKEKKDSFINHQKH